METRVEIYLETKGRNLFGNYEYKFICKIRVEIDLVTRVNIYLENTSINLFGNYR